VPIYDTTMVAVGFETRIEKLPSISVEAPMVLPFSTTEAPIIGSPVLSRTVPVTVDCADILNVIAAKSVNNNILKFRLMIVFMYSF
jgi:hypothetical protein